jgi:hypothetical protein
MAYKEAIALVTATIAAQSLSELQINVLRGAGNSLIIRFRSNSITSTVT